MLTGTPIIIPIFLPHLGCRERCLFCNQKAVTTEIPSASSVQKFIETSIMELPFNKQDRERQIAFYGGSFTAIAQADQVYYLEAVQPFLHSGRIHSIRISTRPDALDEEALSLLKAYAVKTVEIGAQSMVDEVLLLARRGHGPGETASATRHLRQCGFEVGIHLMMGLPADTGDRFLQTLDQVICLRPDFVRIHPTLVLRGSPLESLWRAGKYSPLTLAATIQWLKGGLLKLEKANIRVARIGLQPTKELERSLLAGPYHSALHQLVDSEIFFEMAKRLLQIESKGPEVLFFCHPREVSSFRGQRNGNILKLQEVFRLKKVSVHQREEVPMGSLFLHTPGGYASIKRKDLMV
ncbi:MAG: elongator complex protein 3 [Thermodesulfobacteriota bacterium]